MELEMKKKIIRTIGELILFSCSALAITGCQTLPYQPYARTVKSKPQEGGVIALKLDHRDEDSAKARELMARNCGHAQAKVLEEGEVVIGQETSTNGNTSHHSGTSDQQVGSLFGVPLVASGEAPRESTQSVSATSAIKEWQISYTCVAEGKSAEPKNVSKGKSAPAKVE